MKRLTKEQAIVISAYTGFLCCDFGDMHEDVEKRLGSPILSHMFGSQKFVDDVIKPLYKEDFISMVPEEDAKKWGK